MSIVVDHLTKIYRVVKQKSIFKPRFEQKVALNNISFQIDQGESVAYIGPNGSGKSTTIKLLTGLLTPTSGKVTVNGLEPYKKKRKREKHRIRIRSEDAIVVGSSYYGIIRFIEGNLPNTKCSL